MNRLHRHDKFESGSELHLTSAAPYPPDCTEKQATDWLKLINPLIVYKNMSQQNYHKRHEPESTDPPSCPLFYMTQNLESYTSANYGLSIVSTNVASAPFFASAEANSSSKLGFSSQPWQQTLKLGYRTLNCERQDRKSSIERTLSFPNNLPARSTLIRLTDQGQGLLRKEIQITLKKTFIFCGFNQRQEKPRQSTK